MIIITVEDAKLGKIRNEKIGLIIDTATQAALNKSTGDLSNSRIFKKVLKQFFEKSL